MVFVMPIPEPDKFIDETPLERWASDFQLRFPESMVRGLLLERYDRPLWGNGTHFNEEGAEIFTSRVAEEVLEIARR